MDHARPSSSAVIVGRYALHGEIASGGMATIHVGRLIDSPDSSQTFAVKRLHPHLSKSPEFVAMFLDEARVAARIRHPNVVSIIDVVSQADELLLVMDYIEGESLSRLLGPNPASHQKVAPEIAVRIMADVLEGLHAAHEITDDNGVPLGVVHRDVSPQNVLVGTDGVSHLIDFGVAKAAGRLHVTKDGAIKGKIAYMAPEQIRGTVDRRADVYAASTVLWEMLVGRRIFPGVETQVIFEVLNSKIVPAGSLATGISKALDAAIMKGLAKEPERRFANALQMAEVIKRAVRPATTSEVAHWLQSMAGPALSRRAQVVAEAEGRAVAAPQASRGSGSYGSRPEPPRMQIGSYSDANLPIAQSALQQPLMPAPQTTAAVARVAATATGQHAAMPATTTGAYKTVTRRNYSWLIGAVIGVAIAMVVLTIAVLASHR